MTPRATALQADEARTQDTTPRRQDRTERAAPLDERNERLENVMLGRRAREDEVGGDDHFFRLDLSTMEELLLESETEESMSVGLKKFEDPDYLLHVAEKRR